MSKFFKSSDVNSDSSYESDSEDQTYVNKYAKSNTTMVYDDFTEKEKGVRFARSKQENLRDSFIKLINDSLNYLGEGNFELSCSKLKHLFRFIEKHENDILIKDNYPKFFLNFILVFEKKIQTFLDKNNEIKLNKTDAKKLNAAKKQIFNFIRDNEASIDIFLTNHELNYEILKEKNNEWLDEESEEESLESAENNNFLEEYGEQKDEPIHEPISENLIKKFKALEIDLARKIDVNYLSTLLDNLLNSKFKKEVKDHYDNFIESFDFLIKLYEENKDNLSLELYFRLVCNKLLANVEKFETSSQKVKPSSLINYLKEIEKYLKMIKTHKIKDEEIILLLTTSLEMISELFRNLIQFSYNDHIFIFYLYLVIKDDIANNNYNMPSSVNYFLSSILINSIYCFSPTKLDKMISDIILLKSPIFDFQIYINVILKEFVYWSQHYCNNIQNDVYFRIPYFIKYITHLCLCGKFSKAQELFISTNLTELTQSTDVISQILFNRVLCHLALSAFYSKFYHLVFFYLNDLFNNFYKLPILIGQASLYINDSYSPSLNVSSILIPKFTFINIKVLEHIFAISALITDARNYFFYITYGYNLFANSVLYKVLENSAFKQYNNLSISLKNLISKTYQLLHDGDTEQAFFMFFPDDSLNSYFNNFTKQTIKYFFARESLIIYLLHNFSHFTGMTEEFLLSKFPLSKLDLFLIMEYLRNYNYLPVDILYYSDNMYFKRVQSDHLVKLNLFETIS